MRKLIGLGVLLATISLAASACSSTTKAAASPALKAVQASAAKTIAAKTATMSLVVNASGAVLPGSSSSGGSTTTAASSGSTTTTIAAGPTTVTVSGPYDFATNLGQLSLTVGGSLASELGTSPIDVVTTNTSTGWQFYVNWTQLSKAPIGQIAAAVVPSGTQWAKISLANLGILVKVAMSLSSNPLSGFTAVFNGGSPAAMFPILLSAVSAATKTGTITVGGVPATNYNATVSLANILAKYPNKKSDITAMEKALGGVTTLPITVALDSSGRVAQLGLSLSTGTGGPKVTMTMNFSGYGVPVSVTVPSGSTVFDINAIASTLNSL